jgi:hypothetical protein
MITIENVKSANPIYFAPGTASFFGDVNYTIYRGKVTKNPFMVRKTSMWSDMFGGKKTYVYRINPINKTTLKVGELIDDIFNTIDDVKRYLEEA